MVLPYALAIAALVPAGTSQTVKNLVPREQLVPAVAAQHDLHMLPRNLRD